ncbi:MAG: exodeoxyribonuclease VII small subunit [Sphingomonadales bacterium]|nr:exodeoxyribonuclease VII small subunit [Sphingomonadales bacterium]
MSTHKQPTPSSIESRMNQIRALMARMQKDEGSLDESLMLYREATALIADCQNMLEDAAKSLLDDGVRPDQGTE